MLVLPKDSSWRHYRVRTATGGWIKIKRQVKNSKELNKAIPPDTTDIFISASSFLEPQRLKNKKDKDRPFVIDNRLVLDIDEDFSFKGLETARLKTLRLLEFMDTQPDYELEQITFTGSKGFCLLYKDKGLELPANPRQRETVIENRRQALLNILPVEVDTNSTKDAYRVIRVPNSVNSKTGYYCTILTRRQLEKPIDELLLDIPYATKERPAMPESGQMRGLAQLTDEGGNECSGRNSPPMFSPMCVGTKDRYILVLKYSKERDYTILKEMITGLIKFYMLTEVFAFEDKTHYYFICNKTFQQKRLNKIKNKSKGIECNFVPLDIEYIESIDSTNTNSYISKGHQKLIDLKKAKLGNLSNQHGICKVEFKWQTMND